MVFVNTNDLKHILDQIRIAEQHVAGTPLTDLVANPLLPYGLRLVDGTLNNLTEGREDWGSADQVMPRLLESTFLTQPDTAHLADASPRAPQDGPTSYLQTSGSVYDAEPRIISNLVADQTLSNPAVIAAALSHSGLTGQAMLSAANEIVQAYQRVIDAQAATGNVDQALELQRQQLQSALDTASAELTTAQNDVSAKTTAKADADQAVIDAQSALDTAAATMVALQSAGQVGEAQAALTAAQNALNAAQVELDAAKASAASMLTMHGAKQTEVTNLQIQKATADQALASAQSTLSDAEAALALETDAAGAVTEAQTAVDNATTAVSEAQASVDALDAQLTQAQADLADLNTQLQTAQQAQNDAQARVTAAQEAAAETQVARDNAQSLFDTEVTELATAQADMLSALDRKSTRLN